MMNENGPKKLKKPAIFDQLYPGRFLKASELMGKKVTLTIDDYDLEELQGEDGTKKAKAIISFRESEKKLVACKTTGTQIREMFGKQLSEWVGKRVTLFEDQWNGEPCIRIWGSPDLTEDKEIMIQLPRRRPFKCLLRKVSRAVPPAPERTPGADDDQE